MAKKPENMGYRELQKLAGKMGLKASGTKKVLLNRIMKAKSKPKLQPTVKAKASVKPKSANTKNVPCLNCGKMNTFPIHQETMKCSICGAVCQLQG